MNTQASFPDGSSLRQLRQEWGLYVLACVLFLSVGFVVLLGWWGREYALAWLSAAAGLSIYLFLSLWQQIPLNRPKDIAGAALFRHFGLANGLTITRAVFVSALAGFVFIPRPATGWLAWAPSGLYLAAALLDYLDGYVARVTHRTTALGEVLDMQWDGAGMLFAALLAVLYGQAPLPYLLVGLARYLFLLGIWIRKKRGLPVNDLPPARFRRVLAGTQMGFVAVILMPVFEPPFTQIAAVLFMLPLLIGFLRDFLAVSGRQVHFLPGDKNPAARPAKYLLSVLPLGMRVLLVILLFSLLFDQVQAAAPVWGVILAAGLAVPALFLGLAGRIAALMVLLMAGMMLPSYPQEWRYWVALFSGAILFMSGTGKYSLWKPEDWLIDHRAGETK